MPDQTRAVLKVVREFNIGEVPQLIDVCEQLIAAYNCTCTSAGCAICALEKQLLKVKTLESS